MGTWAVTAGAPGRAAAATGAPTGPSGPSANVDPANGRDPGTGAQAAANIPTMANMADERARIPPPFDAPRSTLACFGPAIAERPAKGGRGFAEVGPALGWKRRCAPGGMMEPCYSPIPRL